MKTLAERIAALPPEKRAILEQKMGQQHKNTPPKPQIPRRPHQDTAPLSFAQERLWFLQQLTPNNPFYNMSMGVYLTGQLNKDALGFSLQEMIRRHEILRTVFQKKKGQPRQHILPALTIDLPETDLTHVPIGEREAQLMRFMKQEVKKPFDLADPPLIRATLVKIAEEKHALLLVWNHILSDGWSNGVFAREITQLYDAFAANLPSPLPDLTIQYADFAVWQRERTQRGLFANQLAYWQEQLSGQIPVLDLPADFPRPAIQTFRGARQDITLPKPLVERLRKLSQAENSTLYMVLLTAFKALLYRYTGQEEILVGSDIANRNHIDIEPLIGFFANTLVIRTNLAGHLTYRQLLYRVRDTVLKAFAHQDIPFEKLVEILQPERDMSRPPFFQVMLSVHQQPAVERNDISLTMEPILIHTETAKFDMELAFVDSSQTLRLSLEYCTDLFDADTINRMIAHYQVLLESIVMDPDQRLDLLPLLTEAERKQLLVDWNETTVHFPREFCFHQLFEEQAARTPEEIAVVAGGTHVNYQTLNWRGNQLAHALVARGIGPDDVVAILAHRGVEFLTAMLGVFKAGAGYLPLDPYYPPQRVAQILQQSESRLVLTTSHHESLLAEALEMLAQSAHPQICLLNDLFNEQQPQTNLPVRCSPKNLAYVIFTSGSTGMPKGAMVEHIGMLNHLYAKIHDLKLAAADKIAQTASQCFDISVWQYLAALLLGGQTVVFDDEITHDPARLLQETAVHNITILEVVPSMLRAMHTEVQGRGQNAYDLRALRWLISTGEALSPGLCQQWFELYPHIPMLNAYGPTECSDDVTHHVITRPPAVTISRMPIGRTINNMQLYILDKNLAPVPIGVYGELYVGGVGVGRGYLNDPQRTAMAFFADPFTGEAGARLYKTGDRVRYLPDGAIEYVNRIDYQVKIRGFRIELGEIEAALRQYTAVAEAVVLARQDDAQDKRLAAYIVPRQAGDSGLQEAQNLQSEQLQNWQQVWDSIYEPERWQHTESPFAASGWTSSYTGQQIPEPEMREWLQHTIERILSLHPQRVYEIGCGVGLLLFLIAPHCQSYRASDFVAAPLARLRQTLSQTPHLQSRVMAEHREAVDFSGIAQDSFDTIILNSVVQYFPSIDYLMQVLEKAVASIQPGGAIFLGDVRNLLLLEAFHASVQIHQAELGAAKRELAQRVRQAVMEEDELVIAPEFFQTINRRFPQVSHVQLQLKRGRSPNELTRFRYDVTLYVKGPNGSEATWQWLDWQKDELSLADVRQILLTGKPDILGITHVPNGRVETAVQGQQWLFGRQGPETVEPFLAALQTKNATDIDPEDFWLLGEETGLQVNISWELDSSEGHYQVLFYRQELHPLPFAVRQQEPKSKQTHHYANTPTRSLGIRDLAQELRTFLKEKLPEYMIPAAFMFLPALPLTANGKVNRKALPVPEEVRADLGKPIIPPRHSLELQLVHIWESLLETKPIGVTDNFFELGGHSLLAVRLMAQIQEVTGSTLPLSVLFQEATIEQLAQAIRRESTTENWSPIVPIQPKGSALPFFCVHPAGGNVFSYLNLANHLGTTRPFYGIQAIGLDGKQIPPVTIEEMAAAYNRALRGQQPQGPYLIGGWSMGGTVAFEMAQQLHAQDEEVALLALFDTPAYPETDPSLDMNDDLAILLNLFPMPVDRNTIDNLDSAEQLTHIVNLAKEAQFVPPDVDINQARTLTQVHKANMLAQLRYQPKPYAKRLALFRAQEQPHPNTPDLGWKDLVEQGLDIITVPGNHISMIDDPNKVKVLARLLKEHLDNSDMRG